MIAAASYSALEAVAVLGVGLFLGAFWAIIIYELVKGKEDDMGMDIVGDEPKPQTINREPIRPARGSKSVRVTWKDENGNAQSIVMGVGPAKVLLPSLVDEMIAGAITELKVRPA